MSVSKLLTAVAGLSLFVSAAFADDAQVDDAQVEVDLAMDDLFAGMAPMEEESLIDLRGGSDTYDEDFIDIDIGDIEITSVENNANSLANISNTAVIGADTGYVGHNVFQGNSGISTFMANSGNNVNFQNTTQINVYTH